MCGISGIRDLAPRPDLRARLERMNGSLLHRGPDGAGHWVDAAAGIALGHRRLAIVDLSETGSQPMTSACGRYVISYNGELYNTQELRERLLDAGDRFRGTSDTEVLLGGIARWGLEATLQRVRGIFAFAVWDRDSRALHLARDHVGVKPLFWARCGHTLLFASELRALAALPEFDRTLDPAGIATFLQYKYIRSPFTIFKQARCLEPGTVLTFAADGSISTSAYWSLGEVVARTASQRSEGAHPAEVVGRLEAVLADSVRRQLVSDVPIGAFLSGGIDSSTVVALMQQVSPTPVRTFSIGFDVAGFDEAPAAKAVAAHLGTDHNELYISAADAIDCVPRLASIYDQPLADVSGVATYLLCRMARAQVTVALSGDGGDELFFGYDRYVKAARLFRQLGMVPGALRSTGGGLAELIGGEAVRNHGLSRPGALAKARWQASRLMRFASRDLSDAYLHFITAWPEPQTMARGASPDWARWEAGKRFTPDPVERMMMHDALTYLPDCVLAKVDRASMATSLEARVPLLDHSVIEHAWTIPLSHKYRDGVGKWCLREILYRHVPRALVDRPKSGFGAPLGQWLRGPLREWGEALLSREAVARWGVLDEPAVTGLWGAHQSGAVDVSDQLWSLLMLHAWMEESRSSPPQVSERRAAAGAG